MPDQDPATLAERVLRLSRSPPFDLMPVEDVTVLAAAGREQSFPTRTVLAHAGERSMAHYVPLAGRLRLSDHVIEATATHGGVGALSVLGGVVLPVRPRGRGRVGAPGARRAMHCSACSRSTVTSPARCCACSRSSSSSSAAPAPPHVRPGRRRPCGWTWSRGC